MPASASARVNSAESPMPGVRGSTSSGTARPKRPATTTGARGSWWERSTGSLAAAVRPRSGGHAQALLRASQLLHRLFELGEPLLLALDHVGLRLAEEVLVAELLLHRLEIVEQLRGLASETAALLVDVDQTLERQEDLGAVHHR